MTISDISQVSFCNSPVVFRIDLLTDFPAYVASEINTRIRLQLTTFDINDALQETNVTVHLLDKERVSNTDKYVSFDNIGSYLKNDLIRKDNFNNVDFPVLLYHNTSLPYVQGIALFYRIDYYAYVIGQGSTPAVNVPNRVATLGYRWRNEQDPFYGSFAGNANGFNISQTPIKKYAEYIPYYFKQSFNFGTNRTSNNFITTTQDFPTEFVCVKEPLLLIYINRDGLFEAITTTGKVVVNDDVKRVESQKSFRDGSMVNTESSHFKNTDIEEVFQTYTVNTGILDESMNASIEELIYSPKIYLVRFYGDRWSVAQQGLTVDNNIVTIDNTTITIDSDTITVNDIGYYSSYLQVPVTCSDSDFTQKTNKNDKREISYTLKFKETASKIKK